MRGCPPRHRTVFNSADNGLRTPGDKGTKRTRCTILHLVRHRTNTEISFEFKWHDNTEIVFISQRRRDLYMLYEYSVCFSIVKWSSNGSTFSQIGVWSSSRPSLCLHHCQHPIAPMRIVYVIGTNMKYPFIH